MARGTTLIEQSFQRCSTLRGSIAFANRFLLITARFRSASSLTLSGGFDAASSTGLHSPGSLYDYACAYYS